MQEFTHLLNIADRLLSPTGCPWDREQTFYSLQPYLVEEVYEILEAVDEQADEKIVEELGDLLYTLIFYAKLGEKEGRFDIRVILEGICNKLIYRHPHIFGDAKAENPEEVVDLFDKQKKSEKGQKERKSAIDGIPPKLPLLPRAQKVLKRIRKAKKESMAKEKISEEEVSRDLLNLLAKAERNDIDVESVLRRSLASLEKKFREEERF